MKARPPGQVGDTFCDAFKPYVATILYSAYAGQEAADRERVMKVLMLLLLLHPFPPPPPFAPSHVISQILGIWKQKEIYNAPTIAQLDSMVRQADNVPTSLAGPVGGRGGLGYQPGPQDRAPMGPGGPRDVRSHRWLELSSSEKSYCLS